MNFKYILLLVFGVVIVQACQEQPKINAQKSSSAKADSVKQIDLMVPGQLNVLMSNDVASYYILKGQPRGFEYEMIKLFCADNQLELKLKVVRDFDFLLDSLQAGKGDLAAGNLTITAERKQHVDFSPPLMRTRQVLVQRLPKDYRKLSRRQRKARMVGDALELDGKKVYVNAGSAFNMRLRNYAQENGIDIEIINVASEIGADELVKMVAEAEIDFTVVDENVAKIHNSHFKNIDISVPLSLSQNIAWAIPKKHKYLADMLADWMADRKNSTRYNMIYNKYFGSRSQLKKTSNYLAAADGQISPYDDLIKKHAEYIHWDWLMLAALINKESRFNPHAHSSFNAKGLMQVLPTTAERFGISESALFHPEPNIMAGTRFLQYLDQFWLKRLQHPEEVKYFVLASYNAGPGHVLDAMYLAEKYGLDPHRWHNNVEVMLRNKSQPKYYRDPVAKRGYCNGKQPVDYVAKIMRYYSFYQAFAFAKGNQNQLAVE